MAKRFSRRKVMSRTSRPMRWGLYRSREWGRGSSEVVGAGGAEMGGDLRKHRRGTYFPLRNRHGEVRITGTGTEASHLSKGASNEVRSSRRSGRRPRPIHSGGHDRTDVG